MTQGESSHGQSSQMAKRKSYDNYQLAEVQDVVKHPLRKLPNPDKEFLHVIIGIFHVVHDRRQVRHVFFFLFLCKFFFNYYAIIILFYIFQINF